jgi:L-threonylcarbamoyladenylate synthase
MASPITTDVLTAAKAIAAGQLCAIPTETVYGLAADATNPDAIARVFAAKGRPTDHPLIVHVENLEAANQWFSQLPIWATKLATEIWPGPLTIVAKRTELAIDVVTGGQDTVAVRVPSHPMAQQLLTKLSELGIAGVVAPSANRFGHVSPTSAEHVAKDLGEYLLANHDLILDGGVSEVGLESTMVLATGANPVILRPGAITKFDIEKITGLPVSTTMENSPRVSGSLDSHYAPTAKVVLVKANEIPNDLTAGYIGFGGIEIPSDIKVLLAAKNIEDYAANLYQALRAGDQANLSTIYAVLPDGDDLAIAVRDRLTRAAH